MKLLIPFVAVLLACNAIGQQADPSAGNATPAQSARKRTREISTPQQPSPEPPPPRATRLFVFPGGTPTEFLAAVDKAMGSHLSEIATIPDGTDRIRVPQRGGSGLFAFHVTCNARCGWHRFAA